MSNYFCAQSNDNDTLWYIWAYNMATADDVARYTLDLAMAEDNEEGDGYAVVRIERADMTAEEIAEAEAAWAKHTEKVTVKVDEETDSDEWWTELRADAHLCRWEDKLMSCGEIAMERGEYLKLAALPGFETGDKHAPTVLMIAE